MLDICMVMVCCCFSPDSLPLLSTGAAFLSTGLPPGTWQSYRSCPSLPLPLLRLLLLRPASPLPTPLLSPLLPLCLPCSSTPALTHYPGTQLTTGEKWMKICFPSYSSWWRCFCLTALQTCRLKLTASVCHTEGYDRSQRADDSVELRLNITVGGF